MMIPSETVLSMRLSNGLGDMYVDSIHAVIAVVLESAHPPGTLVAPFESLLILM